MGCAWFRPKVLEEESTKKALERRALTWRATGVVSLKEENLTALPRLAYEQGPLIKEFDASHNKLEVLGENILYLSKLQKLTLSHNRLSLLNGRIVQLSKLRVLILNDNNLLEIPSTIGRLTNLEHLNLENNKIRVVPESIGYMTRLRTLQLANNKLETLPETIGGCLSLEELDAKHNKLAKLPEYICKLENLFILLVDNNMIEELPESIFEKCKQLHTFSVHQNPILSAKIQSLSHFKDYNQRRLKKYDKQIYGGVMKDKLDLDEDLTDDDT